MVKRLQFYFIKIKNIFYLNINYINKLRAESTCIRLMITIFSRFFQNIILNLVLSIYMPETFMSSTNLTDNEKIAFMVGFIIVSTVVSYTLQNYQCKSPDSIESNPAFQHLLDSNTLPQPPLG
jgi:hypothetical protein